MKTAKSGFIALFAIVVANCASTSTTQEDVGAQARLNILEALTPVDQPVEAWLPLSLAAKKTSTNEPQFWAAGRSKTPARIEDRAMRIASISKMAIAYGAMALVEQGIIDLDEDVSTYLGWRLRHPDYPDVPITVRHLLSHQSSIVDGGPYQFAMSVHLKDVLKDPKYYLDGKAPGTYFNYTNMGYGVLATVMEAAAEQRFDLIMSRLVFQPAGLDIGFNWHGVTLSKQAQALPVGRFAVEDGDLEKKPTILIQTLKEPDAQFAAPAKQTGAELEDEAKPLKLYGNSEVILIFKDADPILPSPTRAALEGYRPGINATVFSPAGGLRASLRDVAALGELIHSGGLIGGKRILASKTVKRMLSTQWRLNDAGNNGDTYGGLMTAYGLGVQIYEPKPECFEAKRRRYYGHFGEAYGLLGGVLVDLKSDTVFAYLLPYTPSLISAELSACSGLYRWEEQFLKTALAP